MAGYWSNGEDLAGERADARADALERAVERETDSIEHEPARIAATIREALADGTDDALIDDLANLIYQRKTTTGASIAVSVAVNRLVSEFERVAQPYAYAALKASRVMDAIKHTPAPWNVSNGGMQIYAAKKHLATCHYSGSPAVDVDEAFANARLIAAAPELLKVAKECSEILAELLDGYEVANPRNSIEKARVAIAKARGKS